MNHLGDLIAELCPDGVEFRPMGEVGQFVRGGGFQKSDLIDRGVPAIHYGQIHTLYGVWTKESKSFVTPEKATRLRYAEPGDLIIATTSEDDAAVGKATAWLGSEKAVVSGDAFIYRHSLDPRYVSYFFSSRSFQTQKQRHITGAKVRRISGAALAKVTIPAPPLEVQREIVRILDHFTELEAELEAELGAELEARRVQYAHYLDELLVGSDALRFPLGELGTFSRGRRFTKADYVDDGISAIHYGEIYTHYGTSAEQSRTQVDHALRPQLRFARTGDVIVAAVGETVDDVGKAVAWLGTEPVAIHDDCFAYSHELNPKYVAYWFQTSEFHAAKNQYVARAKVKRLSGVNLGRIPIAVPSEDEQARIVATLDKFDARVNDIRTGLYAEITARREQYKYYRDKLLIFEEKR